MKSKQLVILLAVLAVTGGTAAWLVSKQKGAITTKPVEVGKDLLKDFRPAETGLISINDGKNQVTVKQKDGVWVIPSRDDFPASLTAVNEVLDNAFALKVGEVNKIGPSQYGTVKLKSPDEKAPEEETGTAVSLQDASGKELAGFIAGKTKMPDMGANMMNMSEAPKSQWMRVNGVSDYVFQVRDGFSRLEADPKNWLDKEDFFKVENLKSISVTGTSPDKTWAISRDVAAGPLKLEAPAEGEEFDPTKATGSGNAFQFAQFVDVLPAAEKEKAGLDKPQRTVTIETFDGVTYNVVIGAAVPKEGDAAAAGSADNLFLTVSAEGKFEEQRTPPAPKEDGTPAETEDQKKAADEAFAKALTEKKEKLAKVQALKDRVFIVAKYTADAVMKKRSDFMKEKPAAVGEAGDLPPGVSPPVLPGNQPAATPQRIEAVTPPIAIDIPAKDDKPKEDPKEE